MEKIEIKHLAPYLPYGLKWTSPFGGADRMTGIITDNVVIDSYKTEINESIDLTYTKESRCKPILRPLSDLTKELEHNGKKITPIIQICKIISELSFYIEKKWNICKTEMNFISITSKECHHSFELDLEDCEIIMYNDNEIHPINDRYKVYDFLNELHFDWRYSLIEKGLAIDINTL